jgi:TPR repeat protein
MKQIILILISVITVGCVPRTTSEQQKEIENASTKVAVEANTVVETCGNQTRPISVLKPLVLKGNIKAYNELFIAFLDIDDAAFLPYALLMANKYDYHRAYYDVFLCLILLYWDYDYSSSFSKLDNQTRKMAIDYLKKGAEKEERNSLRRLGEFYIEGKFVEKDTVLGNQLLEKARRK